ncbi:CAP-associated domain-containing protein, partial [Corynebacterium sp. UMB8791]
MTIYSNFAFNFHHEAYDVELMEEDMNYRPLVAFDNGSFAVLFFNQRTGGLMAVNYVNKETLLTEMPYQLNEGSPLPVDITQSMTFDP